MSNSHFYDDISLLEEKCSTCVRLDTPLISGLIGICNNFLLILSHMIPLLHARNDTMIINDLFQSYRYTGLLLILKLFKSEIYIVMKRKKLLL
jgi:hypothetical protein